MSKTGVVFGRFQIVHLGYMEYILSAKRKCDNLIIGIANADSEHLLYNRYQSGCLRQKMNPFTYLERMEMIQAGLEDFDIRRYDYQIVPFPLEDPNALASYIPADAVIYMCIFDEWGREKKEALEKYGYAVEVLRYGNPEEKQAYSSGVLKNVGLGGNWGKYVSKRVEKYMVSKGLDKRVEALWAQSVNPENDDIDSQIKYSADYEREQFEKGNTGSMDRQPSIDELAQKYDKEVWEENHPPKVKKELDII